MQHGNLSTLRITRLIFISALVVALTPPAGLKAHGKKSGWIEVRSPHFTVISNTWKNQAKLVAFRLELIHAALHSIFLRKSSSQPCPLKVLAMADKLSFQRLLPEELRKPGTIQPAGLFTNTDVGPYIILRTDIFGRANYIVVLHEYTHYVMRRELPGLPPWLAEGLANFYGNTIIKKHAILLGVANPSNLALLHDWSLIPIRTLVQIGYKAPSHKRRIDGLYIFYAESWALADYLLMRDAKNHTHLLSDYEQQVAHGSDPLGTFNKLFGSTKKMDKALSAYVRRDTFPALKYPITERISSKHYAVRRLSRAEADCDQAEYLLLEGQLKEAAKLLKVALADAPHSARAHALMGFLLEQQGDRGRAAQQAQEAIQLNPKDYRGYYYAALAMNSDHMSAAHAKEAEQDLRRALALNPHLPGAQNLLAEVYLSQGQKLNLALAWALRALQEEPDNNNFLTNVETILLKQGRQADAVAFEMRMLKRAGTPKKQAQVRNQIGWTLLEQNIALQRADFEIRKANELDPQNPHILNSLAHLLEQEGDLAQSDKVFHQALAHKPQMAASLEGLADVLRKQHQLDKAIAEYHKALAVAPQNARAHYGLSLALKEKGDASEAKAEMQTAHRLDPFNTQYQQGTPGRFANGLVGLKF